mgnify:CR=1 FL=1
MRKRTVEIEVLRQRIKAAVSAIPDTNFMWCVRFYFKEYNTKDKFMKSNFFDEFAFDGNLKSLLYEYFCLTSFVEFRNSLREMSNQVVAEKMNSDETEPMLRSWLTNYVSAEDLRQRCAAEPSNRNNVFMYLFKVLEPFFLFTDECRPDSESMRLRAKSIYTKYAKVPDEDILEVLDSNSSCCLGANAVNVDDDWMIEHLFASIWLVWFVNV